MSRKHFSLLLVVTVVAALLVLLMPGKTGRESEAGKSSLLPGLQEQVNQLDWLRITGPGGEVIATLSRGEGYWRVDEANGYRADWGQLKILLSDLAQAEIVESKTDNPEYYDRLGVGDVSEPGAGGLLIEFREAEGLPAVIVGNRTEGRDGHYLRLRDSAQSVLIDRSLEVPTDRMSWLQQDIIHIADNEVVEVDVLHPDGERVRARKTSADDENFALQDIPQGREIQSAWSVDSLANGLASLTLEEVVPDSDVDWAGAVHFGVVTADGLRVDAELATVGTPATGGETDGGAGAVQAEPGAMEYWLRLQASLYETAVESAVEAPDEGGDETGGRAESINQRVSGWAYRIPKFKYDAMTKRMEQLLKAPESSGS